MSVFHHLHGYIYGLEHFLLGDSGQDKAAFVQSFGSFGACADADSREWLSYGSKEGAFFRQCTGIGDYGEYSVASEPLNPLQRAIHSER